MADNYSITGQRQTSEIGPGGRFQDVMEISFQTPGGTVGTVRVPLNRYGPDAVKAAIEDYVAKIQAVESL